MPRLAKQLIIGGIYAAIIVGILWSAYRAVVPAATCSDGVQNGGEEGVDCGARACGVLCAPAVQPLVDAGTTIMKAGGGYDVLAHLENPNALYGASRVDYTMRVTDAAGTELAVRSGFTYVNPMQPRYLLFPLGSTTAVPASAQLQFDQSQVQWGALTIDAQGDIQFGIRNEQFIPASESVRYEASVLNRSRFDFDTVDIVVLLLDARGNIVSANTTVQRTLKAGEERAFVMEWPFAVPDAVRARAIVTTNVFLNANFLRAYGSPGQVQEF